MDDRLVKQSKDRMTGQTNNTE